MSAGLDTQGPRSRPCCSSVEEQASFGILHDPIQAFLQVLACHRTTPQNVPPVSADLVQSQGLADKLSARASTEVGNGDAVRRRLPANLGHLLASHAPLDIRLVCEHKQACPRESLSRLSAAATCQTAGSQMHGGMRTSSWSRPCSSSLQSSMRSLSVASATQIRASVFSK